MDATPSLAPNPTAERLFQAHRNFHVLLALAHDELAVAAIRVTDALARERAALPGVVQVFDPTPYAPVHPIPKLMAFAEELIGPQATQVRRLEIQGKLSDACGYAVSWPITILLGDPPTCIANEARRSASDLIVLGLHPYGTVERLLGSETTARVIANVGRPVLAVTSRAHHLPVSVLAAIDFSRASVAAAKAAARLVGPSGLMVLVHVKSRNPTAPREETEGMEFVMAKGVSAAFSQLVREIVAETPLSIKTVVLEGETAPSLITQAERMQPDLIAVGSQRHSFLHRLVVGSVARSVVRDGRWSVLVVPPARPVEI